MADAYPIPDEALDDHIAILGKTGSGKSNAAKTLVEEALDRSERVCVLDPTGTWYGLRLTRAGKPSKYPIVIFGGQHADLPIQAQHGAAIAEMVGTTSTPAVIDTRLLTVGARTRFFTDFAEGLLRTNAGTLRLVIDEAHLFAPQGKVNDPQSGAMVHAANNLVSLGRGLGLRIVMLSQRPAKLHKDSLSQVETLVAMRLIAPQDRGAIEDWMKEQADPSKGREIVASLPSLPTGDAWIWSPQIGVLKRARFPLAATFDSGKAPAGDAAGSPTLAALDLETVSERLKTFEAEAKANDPANLKAQIATLTRDLAKATDIRTRNAGPTPPPVTVTVVANADEIEAARKEGERVGIAVGLSRAMTALQGLRVDEPGAPVTARQRRPAPAPESASASPAPITPSGGLTVPQQRILNALAWWKAFGIDAPSNEQVGFVAGYSPGSGNFNNLRGQLRAGGLLDYPAPGAVRLTDAGLGVAETPAIEVTEAAFHAKVRAKLTGPQLRLFEPILGAYPKSLSTEELASAADYSAGSGNFNNLRGQLRTVGLIDYPSSGQVRAADWLFPTTGGRDA